MTYQLRVRLGEVTVDHLQHHYSMVKVVSGMFGSEEKGVKINDMKSSSQAVSELNKFFGA